MAYDFNNKKPRKVLHIIYSLEVGGAEKVVYHYALYHRREKFIPLVCAIRKGGQIEKDIKKLGVKVYILGRQNYSALKAVMQLAKIMKDEEIDIIHTHGPVANSWSLPAMLISGVRHSVKTEHNVSYAGRKAIIHLLINRMFSFANDKVIAVSDAVKEAHLKWVRNGKNKFVTILNGIDPKPFDENASINMVALRKELGVSPEKRIVGTVGSLTSQKCQEVFLQAMSVVIKRHPDVCGIIAGEGPLLGELKCLSNKLGVSDNIIFCGLRTDVPKILKLLEVFVLSSNWEGFPVSILEAMAAGLPSVSTDVGGVREAISDGINGFLVPPRDPEFLAERICKILENKKISNEMGSKARKKFEENFTAEKMVWKTEELYSEILGDRQK